MTGEGTKFAAAPSPFITTVSQSAFAPPPGKASDGNLSPGEKAWALCRAIKTGPEETRYLREALIGMRLRDTTGQPLSEEKLALLAQHFAMILQRSTPDNRNIFELGALETIALYVQNSRLNSRGKMMNEAEEAIARHNLELEIARALNVPENLTKSDSVLSDVLNRGGIQQTLHELMMKTAEPEKEPKPGTKEFEYQNWGIIYDVLRRTLDLVQIDPAVRHARFLEFFTKGIDQAGMYALCLFVLAMLIGRMWKMGKSVAEWRRIARHLQNNPERFRRLAVPLSSIRFPALMANFTRQMLRAAFGASRGDPRTPDMLIIRAESYRESNNRSRWLISFCAKAVATVGFLAKLVGIAAAMERSDAIARATGSFAQGAAIAQVSASLATAFCATLSAFALSLLLSYADAFEAYYESCFIDEVEDGLMDTFEGSGAPVPALARVAESAAALQPQLFPGEIPAAASV